MKISGNDAYTYFKVTLRSPKNVVIFSKMKILHFTFSRVQVCESTNLGGV
jgi:hypothetical protein